MSRPSVTRLAVVVAVVALPVLPLLGATSPGQTWTIHGATVERGAHAIPKITAANDYDALYALGYVQAQDRLFQMDLQRRIFSGTLAELVGEAALPQDIQLRTLGLRRAAVASAAAASPEAMVWLGAYADGVNAYLANEALPLPPEYGALELSRASIPPWSPVDSLTVAKGLAFGLSFDLSDIDYTIALLTFQAAGAVVGFDGTALFFEDLYRTAPFDPTISIPGQKGLREVGGETMPRRLPSYLGAETLKLARAYRDAVADIPILRRALERRPDRAGSNWWLTAGSLTESGHPILANDPHLSLDQPSVFYEIEIEIDSDDPMHAFGVMFPGAPAFVHGCNTSICWGSTVHPMDVTDVFQEKLILNPADFLPMGTYFGEHTEPIVRIRQKYHVNQIGDGVADNLADAGVGPSEGGMTFIVPRRNNGPIVEIDLSDIHNITGFSVQYTGWGATREVDAFLTWARATNLDQFRQGLDFFDVGSQNWAYADVAGNIAYFTSGELPIREDLQTMNQPDGGVPPYLIRDGSHQLHHEWMTLTNPQPGQSVPFEILPYAEMPQEVNPARGYILNANNDPVGTSLDNNPLNQVRPGGGLYYLSPGYATGFRIGRLQRLYDEAIASGQPLSVDDIKAFQANNQLLDAEVFVPLIVSAYDAMAAGGFIPQTFNANLGAAADYLRGWDYSTPTGIAQGYDPGDDPSALPAPTQAEIDASIAATIYAVWRGQMLQLVIDAPLAAMGLADLAPPGDIAMADLRHLIDNLGTNQGFGASGVPFIQGGDVVGTTVYALSNALDLLAGDAFAPAFGNSTDLEDYRWGYLHRIVFDHPLGGPFSLPPGGGLADVAPGLPGVARSGGFGTVDASAHSARADAYDEFMFGHGPARRFVGELAPDGITIFQTIPGGESGVIGSPNQADSLMLWLTNDYLEHELDGAD